MGRENLSLQCRKSRMRKKGSNYKAVNAVFKLDAFIGVDKNNGKETGDQE